MTSGEDAVDVGDRGSPLGLRGNDCNTHAPWTWVRHDDNLPGMHRVFNGVEPNAGSDAHDEGQDSDGGENG